MSSQKSVCFLSPSFQKFCMSSKKVFFFEWELDRYAQLLLFLADVAKWMPLKPLWVDSTDYSQKETDSDWMEIVIAPSNSHSAGFHCVKGSVQTNIIVQHCDTSTIVSHVPGTSSKISVVGVNGEVSIGIYDYSWTGLSLCRHLVITL